MERLKKQPFGAAIAASAWLALAACQSGGPIVPQNVSSASKHERDAVALRAADWSKRIDITIEMLDYGYRPREIRLKSGQPYRLTLVNFGAVSHYFTAPEFFAAVAARKAEVRNQAEVKAREFVSFELFGRGGTLDFYFVPLLRGSYRAYCHIKDHQPLGIEGTLVVE